MDNQDQPTNSPHAAQESSLAPDTRGDQSAAAPSKKRAVRFAAIGSAALLVILAVSALGARLEIFGAGFHLNFALVLGVAGTVLLGVGLMALTFYSNRSGADDAVVGMNDTQWRPDDEAR